MGDVRLECKTTSGMTYVLKKADLEKIKSEAISALEEWAFVIQFQKQSGMGQKFVVCDYYTLHSRWAPKTATEKSSLYGIMVRTDKKQVTLERDNLLSEVGIAKRNGATFIAQFTFSEASYGLTTWETYLALKESADA
jgi:hypothetical protein